MDWDFRLVAGPYGGRTDGAVWDGSGLIFASSGENAIRRFDPSTHQSPVLRLHWIRIRGLALDAQGVLFGCQSGSRRVVRFNPDGSASHLRARLDGQMHNCPDDLAIDRHGRIWFSDPIESEPPRGPHIRPFLDHQSVLCLSPRLDDDAWGLQRMTLDTRCPRGVALSADERTLYVADNDTREDGEHEIRTYPIQDDGSLGQGRVLHPLPDRYTAVEGLRLDRAGNIVACLSLPATPGVIAVISWSGNVVDAQALPEGQPTSCAFGGQSEDVLYVTTAEGHLYEGVPV